MYIHEDLLAIVFKLANFGLLIFLCVYAFKRYILPVLVVQMQKEQDEHAAMEGRHTELKTQAKILKSFKQQQDDLYKKLKERVQEWAHVQQQLSQCKEKERILKDERQKKRIALQEKLFTQQRLVHDAVPHALHEARNALNEHYSDEKKRLYLEKIIAVVRKELP